LYKSETTIIQNSDRNIFNQFLKNGKAAE
jgi:hypothetical protein